MKIRSYNDQHSTRISLIPIVAELKSCDQTLRLQPLKPVLLIVANREKQLSLNKRNHLRPTSIGFEVQVMTARQNMVFTDHDSTAPGFVAIGPDRPHPADS